MLTLVVRKIPILTELLSVAIIPFLFNTVQLVLNDCITIVSLECIVNVFFQRLHTDNFNKYC